MRPLSVRSALALPVAALGVTGLCLGGGLVATASPSSSAVTAGETAAPPAAAPSSALVAHPGGVDRSRVFVVSGAEEYADHFAPTATRLASATDKAGSPVVLSTTTSDRLASFHAAAHEGKRCPGFRTFATRAEAEAFIAQDLTAQTVGQAFAAYSIDNQTTVSPWISQVDHTRIKSTITHLSTAYPNRYYASTYGRQAATWIRDTWAGLGAGRSDVTTELFTGCTQCSTQPSVLMTVKGAELPGEVVVVGGHLDSISNYGTGDAMRAPGADDDASGIATITEVARIALKDGWKPKRTVVFAGYAAEEVGLRGSDAVARSFKAQGKNVVGVMQLDMTNYDPGTGVDMAFLTDNVNASLTTWSKQLFDAYLKPAGLVRGDMTCGYACSDHASWTSAGYPSMMAAEPEIFPKLHTTGDTLANLGGTAEPSAKFAKLGLAFVGEVAKSAGSSTPTPTPTQTPTPSGSVLQNGVPRTGLYGAAGVMTGYSIAVPAGARNLTVSTSGSTGDVDLYLKAGSAPTTSSYDCRPYRSGNTETCTVAAPVAGTYYVGLRGYSAYSGVALTASYTAP